MYNDERAGVGTHYRGDCKAGASPQKTGRWRIPNRFPRRRVGTRKVGRVRFFCAAKKRNPTSVYFLNLMILFAIIPILSVTVVAQPEIDRNILKKAEQNDQLPAASTSTMPCNNWIFENGKPVSPIIFYRTGEKWLVHTDFDDQGQLNGVSKEYSKDGRLMALRYYENNELVKRERINRWWDGGLSKHTKTAIIIITIIVITLVIGGLGFWLWLVRSG